MRKALTRTLSLTFVPALLALAGMATAADDLGSIPAKSGEPAATTETTGTPKASTHKHAKHHAKHKVAADEGKKVAHHKKKHHKDETKT